MKSPSEGYNQLQKYLRHCTVFWRERPVHDLVLVMFLFPLWRNNFEWEGGGRSVLYLTDL